MDYVLRDFLPFTAPQSETKQNEQELLLEERVYSLPADTFFAVYLPCYRVYAVGELVFLDHPFVKDSHLLRLLRYCLSHTEAPQRQVVHLGRRRNL